VKWVVVPLKRLGSKLKLLPHCQKQLIEGFGAGGDLIRFQPADRRLLRAHPPSQPLLADSMADACGADQFPRGHQGDYNEFVMNYGLARPPVRPTKACQAGLGLKRGPWRKKPTESQKLHEPVMSFQENQ